MSQNMRNIFHDIFCNRNTGKNIRKSRHFVKIMTRCHVFGCRENIHKEIIRILEIVSIVYNFVFRINFCQIIDKLVTN